MLGLHPGLGGTARFTAPDQSDAGDDADADRQDHRRAGRAKSLGLVDAVTQERHVRNAVKDAVFGQLKTRSGGLLIERPELSLRPQASSPSACARRPPRRRRSRIIPRPMR